MISYAYIIRNYLLLEGPLTGIIYMNFGGEGLNWTGNSAKIRDSFEKNRKKYGAERLIFKARLHGIEVKVFSAGMHRSAIFRRHDISSKTPSDKFKAIVAAGNKFNVCKYRLFSKNCVTAVSHLLSTLDEGLFSIPKGLGKLLPQAFDAHLKKVQIDLTQGAPDLSRAKDAQNNIEALKTLEKFQRLYLAGRPLDSRRDLAAVGLRIFRQRKFVRRSHIRKPEDIIDHFYGRHKGYSGQHTRKVLIDAKWIEWGDSEGHFIAGPKSPADFQAALDRYDHPKWSYDEGRLDYRRYFDEFGGPF